MCVNCSSVHVMGEGVHLPSHRLPLEKLSFSHLSTVKQREVSRDWSLSTAVGILSYLIAALKVLSASSQPTETTVMSSDSSLLPKWDSRSWIIWSR